MSIELSKILRSLKGRPDRHNHYDHHHDHGNYHDGYSRYGHYNSGHGEHFMSAFAVRMFRELSGKLFRNKRLAILVIIALLTVTALLLVCAVWIVIALVKLCGPLISDIDKNGLKSVFDTLSKIVSRIWEGAGK